MDNNTLFHEYKMEYLSHSDLKGNNNRSYRYVLVKNMFLPTI
jgi:hypothetical protein